MRDRTDSPAPRARRGRNRALSAPSLASWTLAGLAGAAAVLSYSHALWVTRHTGTTGGLAFLPPLLPDGLIAVSSLALYAAAQAKEKRPWLAVAGLVLGIAVTIVMNVAAGLANGPGGAAVDALAPVVLIIALEVWIGLVRARRPEPAPVAVDGDDICPHTVALTADEAVRMAWAHAMDCLGERPTYTSLGDAFGIDRRRVKEIVSPPSQPAAGQDQNTPDRGPGEASGVRAPATNGQPPRPAPAAAGSVSAPRGLAANGQARP